MEIQLAINARLGYFYGEKVHNCSVLNFLSEDLKRLSDKYPKIYTSVWLGDITSLYLMSNSTVRVIMLTKDKRLVIGRINGDHVIVDNAESGIIEGSFLIADAVAIIII